VKLRSASPLLCDPYIKNRTAGSFMLIDEATGATIRAQAFLEQARLSLELIEGEPAGKQIMFRAGHCSGRESSVVRIPAVAPLTLWCMRSTAMSSSRFCIDWWLRN